MAKCQVLKEKKLLNGFLFKQHIPTVSIYFYILYYHTFLNYTLSEWTVSTSWL